MIASRVTFSNETRLKLNNPVLDYNKKRELKISRIKEYIRQFPVGTLFKFEDLIYVAGYTKEQYASGYAFVSGLGRNKILDIEKTTRHKKLITIPGDSVIKKPAEVHEDESLEVKTDVPPAEGDIKVEDKPNMEAIQFTRLEYQVVDVELVRTIENLAREFSWTNDSDSLREFIKSIK